MCGTLRARASEGFGWPSHATTRRVAGDRVIKPRAERRVDEPALSTSPNPGGGEGHIEPGIRGAQAGLSPTATSKSAWGFLGPDDGIAL
jgi:hypothetical protein